MPDLPADSVEVEKLVRAALVALFADITGLPHVLNYAIYVEGEAEYVRKFGYKHPSTNRVEYRLLEIVFQDFKDTDAGCADNPIYNLNYVLTLIVAHSDKRPDSTSSTDDAARFILTLRERVLKTDKLAGYENLRCENLEPQGSRFGPDETLNLKAAHVAAFLLTIEVTPSAQP